MPTQEELERIYHARRLALSSPRVERCALCLSFFVPSGKNDKYCGTEHAHEARKMSKLNWWNANRRTVRELC